MLRQDDFNKSQLVLVSWHYGREYGGHLPSLMIMNCLANRFHLGWGSWLEIIERIPQYSAEYKQPTGFPSIWDQNFIRLLHEVDSVYNKSGIDIAKGAIYWADLRRIETEWFKTNIIGKPDAHPRIVDCNSLVLFR